MLLNQFAESGHFTLVLGYDPAPAQICKLVDRIPEFVAFTDDFFNEATDGFWPCTDNGFNIMFSGYLFKQYF
jgi:hypothetical protein